MFLYDNCWLDKKTLKSSPFTSFFIDESSDIYQTILAEMSYFFPNAKLSSKEQAELVFLADEALETVNEEGYVIEVANKTYVKAFGGAGLLYGFFALIRQLQAGKELKNETSSPKNAVRMLNHWDNFTGDVERGYAGQSIFYKNNNFVQNAQRIHDYARLLSSVGINAISINNVNVHKYESYFIRHPYLGYIADIAGIFRKYKIKLFLSVNYAMPLEVNELDNSDPLNPAVQEFWKKEAAVIYKTIPDFGGFIVKADSEGRPGPFTYGRTHADGANMLAKALKPYGGVVFWRCFVYNCQQDWRDRKTDRAKAAYDHFLPLDGKFDDNVILQIKNGPMDFQVRESVSPLFGALRNTNTALEFQIAHEYSGQAKHIFFLPVSWQEVVNFNTHYEATDPTIAGVLQEFPKKNNKLNGITAVVNIGDDYNWTGHKFSQANLFGFGLMTWNPTICPTCIAKAWINSTFDASQNAKDTIEEMLLTSAKTYEDYTAPLGVGWMVNISHHYGPAVNGYEYDRWGTYHFSDRNGIGVDRTLETGSGFSRQFSDKNFEIYNDVDKCPDELKLYFHHVPYDYVLKSGKTVIQHIYDTHFEGVEQVAKYKEMWAKLEGEIDPIAFKNVKDRLEHQYKSACEWRDQINTYYYRFSGVEDAKGRKIYK